jgi:type III secretion protein T
MEIAEIVAVYLLAFARCYAFFEMLPQWQQLETSGPVKTVVVACITPFVGAYSLAHYTEPPAVGFMLLLGKEVLLGLFLGFLVSLPLRLPELMGDLIDNQRGAAVTSQYNPASGEESSVLGQLLMMCVVVYFYSESGLDRLIGILTSSFVLQSVTSFDFGFGDNFFTVAMVIVNNYMQLFAILCLPLILVMLITDVALGMGSRFASSLNVFSLSQPIKAVVSVSMLVSLQPKIMNSLLQFFSKVERMLT